MMRVNNCSKRTFGLVRVMAIVTISMVLISLGPPPVSASTFTLTRVGRYSLGSVHVRALDISRDGKWLVAGTQNDDFSLGGLYLFDYDYVLSSGVFRFNDSAPGIRPYDDNLRGSSRPVAISANASYISVGTIAMDLPSSLCVPNATVGGCVFLYSFSSTGALTQQWKRDFSSAVPSTDIATIFSVSGPAVAAGAGSVVKAFRLDGGLYWDTTISGTVHNVRLSANAEYLAVSTVVGTGGNSTIYFYNNTGSGYSLVWSHGQRAEALNIDLAEDGWLLAAGEDHVGINYAIPANLTQFSPGLNGWDSGDGAPCARYVKPDDIYGVAVAPNRTANTTALFGRVVVGRSLGTDLYGQGFTHCSTTVADQWSLAGHTYSVDSSIGGCAAGTACFSVFGGDDYRVSLVREGDSAVSTDRTGGTVQAVIMSPQLGPRLAAGSDDGYVYFYTIAVTP